MIAPRVMKHATRDRRAEMKLMALNFNAALDIIYLSSIRAKTVYQTVRFYRRDVAPWERTIKRRVNFKLHSTSLDCFRDQTRAFSSSSLMYRTRIPHFFPLTTLAPLVLTVVASGSADALTRVVLAGAVLGALLPASGNLPLLAVATFRVPVVAELLCIVGICVSCATRFLPLVAVAAARSVSLPVRPLERFHLIRDHIRRLGSSSGIRLV